MAHRITPDTQNESYRQLQPKLGDRQQIVLDLIRFRPLTALEVADRLELPINRVSGRITELRKAGMITEAGRRMNPESGKSNIIWQVAA